MTPSQEAHLARMKEAFLVLMDDKYRKGCAEHKGTLLDMPSLQRLKEVRAELLDAFTYIQTEIEKMEKEN
jgi:hypothetical protein